MHDEPDIHEPEHDHLLDHEFHDGDCALQDEVDPMYDPVDDHEDEDEVDWDEGVNTLDDV
ncbi:hypothetical protein N5D52_23250 [Pseudomonas sp. GD03860]|mgnify:CR=1 FL=1|uniref:hypothetical protein n=1 Tax=Pseudomonas TaxID=286 RepID=UPI002364438F|nr:MULTISPECIES: hypothetical protein [Pseudomonas]MDD2058904.1 hypothetical protein [Pseudomonas putida]MDH0639844.1 hypothetical protein [Pseudomonas sp. GD03860]